MPKPRNPGYNAGDHWGICDQCGFAYRQKDLRKRWDGAVVCRWDWEIRHPQDFVRARPEDQSPKGLVRSESPDRFIHRLGIFDWLGFRHKVESEAKKEVEDSHSIDLEDEILDVLNLRLHIIQNITQETHQLSEKVIGFGVINDFALGFNEPNVKFSNENIHIDDSQISYQMFMTEESEDDLVIDDSQLQVYFQVEEEYESGLGIDDSQISAIVVPPIVVELDDSIGLEDSVVEVMTDMQLGTAVIGDAILNNFTLGGAKP